MKLTEDNNFLSIYTTHAQEIVSTGREGSKYNIIIISTQHNLVDASVKMERH